MLEKNNLLQKVLAEYLSALIRKCVPVKAMNFKIPIRKIETLI